MSFNISAGTTIAISASAPATFNSSGYGALSYTSIGEVRELQTFGLTWATTDHRPLNLRGVQRKKTNRDPGTFTATIALDTDDAGQILAKASRDSSTGLYSFKITMAGSGDVYYCQAIVTGYTVTPGSQASDQVATLTAVVSTSATDVDWVEVLA